MRIVVQYVQRHISFFNSHEVAKRVPALLPAQAAFNMATCSHMAKFPIQLHAMLTAVELSGQAHVAGFQPNGRAFRIHKTKQVVTEVLPR
jgi:hypothetical protein